MGLTAGHLQGHQQREVKGTGRHKGTHLKTHLEDSSRPWVQDSNPSVLGRDCQPAAVAVEADGRQQRLRRVAVVDRRQNHPNRVPEHYTYLGNIPEEDLGQKEGEAELLLGEFG